MRRISARVGAGALTRPAEQSPAFLQDTTKLKRDGKTYYADAFAAELAMERGAWLVTADPVFSKIGKGLSVYALPQHEK